MLLASPRPDKEVLCVATLSTEGRVREGGE